MRALENTCNRWVHFGLKIDEVGAPIYHLWKERANWEKNCLFSAFEALWKHTFLCRREGTFSYYKQPFKAVTSAGFMNWEKFILLLKLKLDWILFYLKEFPLWKWNYLRE